MRDVRLRLDENGRDRGLEILADQENLTVDDMISDFVSEAARRATLEAPVWMLEPGHNFGSAVEWLGEARAGCRCRAIFAVAGVQDERLGAECDGGAAGRRQGS